MARRVESTVSPHALEAEKSLLGAILLRNENWAKVIAFVKAEDFWRQAHALIFETLGRLADRGAAMDLVPVVDDLRTRQRLDDVGGPAYVASLVDGVPISTHAEDYAKIVREKARLRHLEATALATLDATRSHDASAAQIAERVLRSVSSVAVDTTARGMVTADEAVFEYVKGLDAGTAAAGIPTGYVDIDDIIGGFRRKELTIIAARPSVGKSSLVLGAARTVARSGVACGYFSPEMTIEMLGGRLLSWDASVPTVEIERKEATEAQYGRISAALGAYAGVPLYLNDSARSVSEIEAWARRLVSEHSIGGIFIDYLQMLVGSASRSRTEEVAGISGALKRLAKDLGIFVVACSQLSRAPDDRRDKRPQLSDLRESGALEQDADTAILLYRAEMHNGGEEYQGIAEAIVAKQRNGPVGIARLTFIKTLAQFRNFAHV